MQINNLLGVVCLLTSGQTSLSAPRCSRSKSDLRLSPSLCIWFKQHSNKVSEVLWLPTVFFDGRFIVLQWFGSEALCKIDTIHESQVGEQKKKPTEIQASVLWSYSWFLYLSTKPQELGLVMISCPLWQALLNPGNTEYQIPLSTIADGGRILHRSTRTKLKASVSFCIKQDNNKTPKELTESYRKSNTSSLLVCAERGLTLLCNKLCCNSSSSCRWVSVEWLCSVRLICFLSMLKMKNFSRWCRFFLTRKKLTKSHLFLYVHAS